MLLYVIRHGDPCYNPDSLTPKGRRQAEAIGRRLALHGIDRVFSSPLKRAQETAQPLCELLHLTPTIEDWTSEMYYWNNFTQMRNGKKDWEFRQPNTRLRSEDNRYLGLADWQNCDCFSDLDLRKIYTYCIEGSDNFLARLGYERQNGVYKITQPNEERVALFCHEGFCMHWFPFLLNIPPHLFWAGFGINHTGLSVFQFINNPDGFTAPRALCLNDTGHLYADGLPTQYQNRFYY